MATPDQEALLYKEGRLELAIQAYQRGEIRSYTKAAATYDIPRNTIKRRISGVPPQRGSISKNRLLIPTEEESLVQWVLSLDRRGMPPRIAVVRDMAQLLLTKRGGSNTPSQVGIHWVQRFINRHNELKSKYSRKHDYQRAQTEDPDLIRKWFKHVQNTIAEYGIHNDDIYNFDETGFQMDVISTAKVVTSSDRAGKPRIIQPGNLEWVSIIETINANGISIPPLIILNAKMHQQSWYKDNYVPDNWSIAVSDTGWTNDQIGFTWLQRVFDIYTKRCAVGRYRLLIFDGHGSHVTPEFDNYCRENGIVVLCMPLHSSHILQPLDVGCFSVLKQLYGQQVEQLMATGINHIDKRDFLRIYQQIRPKALHSTNIRSSFAATGLVPYNPSRVLSLVHAQLHTPSPHRPQTSGSESWTAETPHNIVELQHQTKLIKRYLKRRSQSPPSPTEHALDQLVKGCQMAMHNAVLLASQNERLYAENQRQKRKRIEKRSYIAKGGVLTGAEARGLMENGDNSQVMDIAKVQPVKYQRAPPKCSICGSLQHNARICSERQSVV